MPDLGLGESASEPLIQEHVYPQCAYRVFFCRASELVVAWLPELSFHCATGGRRVWIAMAINRLKYRSREVAIAIAITLAAIAAVLAAFWNHDRKAPEAQPVAALVFPRR